METWMGEKCVTHLITTWNTPQKNGTAERMNQTIMEKACTIQIDSWLNKQLWDKLVLTAVFIDIQNQKNQPIPQHLR